MRNEHPHVAVTVCLAMGVLGYVVAGANATLNVLYGSMLSVTDSGQLWQGVAFALCSAATVGSASFCGAFFRARRRMIGVFLFLLSVVFVTISVWNVWGFVSDQQIGKARISEARQKADADLAEAQNTTTLAERKELRETLFRSYLTARQKDSKEAALGAMERATDRPIALSAPSFDVVAVDTRSALLSEWFGLKRDTIRGVSAMALPAMFSIVEVTFPLIAFAAWPQPGREEMGEPAPAEAFRKLSAICKADARADLMQMFADDLPPPHGELLAERWGVGTGQVSKWLDAFRREGIIVRKRVGQRLIVLPAPRKSANGTVNGAAIHAS